MRSVFQLTTFLLIVGAICVAICSSKSSQDSPSESSTQPCNSKQQTKTRESFDFGIFTIDSSYNRTNCLDKLRLSKFYFKTDFKIYNSTFLSTKLSQVDELLKCDNLTVRREKLPLIDCKPLEAHLMDRIYEGVIDQPTSVADYVKRSSLRFVNKYIKVILGHITTRVDVHLYPLKKDVIHQNIASILAENKIGSGFSSNLFDVGYHFETNVTVRRGNSALPIKCTGNVIISLNTTNNIWSYDDWQEFISEEGYDNGILISFKDVTCFPGYVNEITTLSSNFTIIWRPVFPYITVNHSITSQLWDYQGYITQTRLPNDPVGAYSTVIHIKSDSILDILNFELDQVFEISDSKTGFETMILQNTFMQIFVNAEWTIDSFVKSLKLVRLDSTNSNLSMKPELFVSYEDKPDDEYVNITIKLDKNFFKSHGIIRETARESRMNKLSTDEQVVMWNRNEL